MFLLDFNFKQVMKLSSIKRWVIVEMARDQSVAEHSYNVSAITIYILDTLKCHVEVSDEQYLKAMRWNIGHDLTELMTGDFPSSLKSHFGKEIKRMESNKFPSHAKLQSEILADYLVYVITKAADLVDAIYYARKWCVDDSKDMIIEEMVGKLRTLLSPVSGDNRQTYINSLVSMCCADMLGGIQC